MTPLVIGTYIYHAHDYDSVAATSPSSLEALIRLFIVSYIYVAWILPSNKTREQVAMIYFLDSMAGNIVIEPTIIKSLTGEFYQFDDIQPDIMLPFGKRMLK